MNFIFEWSTQYLTSEHCERVRYRVEHERIKFISIKSGFHIIAPVVTITAVVFQRRWRCMETHSSAILGTLRFATTDGWTRVARCPGEWIEYGALRRVVARKLKLSCYTTNYVLLEITAVEFTLKMSFQKVRDELIYCFADGILDEEEFVLLYDAYKSTNSIYPYLQASFEIQ